MTVMTEVVIRCNTFFLSLALATLFLIGLSYPVGAAVDSPGMRMLQDLESVITDLAEHVKPSVVNVFPASTTRSAGPRERLPTRRVPDPA